MRRQGPHQGAQKSTSTRPLLVSLSKLPSVTVFTLSDAICGLPLFRYARTAFPAGPPRWCCSSCAHS